MAETFTTKLGTTSKAGERTRIWLEGKRLTAHGFTPGTKFARYWGKGELTLIAFDADAGEAEYNTLPRDERGTVSGKGEKPIIDIVGARVRETFGKGESVNVTYRPNKITISR